MIKVRSKVSLHKWQVPIYYAANYAYLALIHYGAELIVHICVTLFNYNQTVTYIHKDCMSTDGCYSMMQCYTSSNHIRYQILHIACI